MKKFIAFLDAEIQKGVESELVLYIANNIILKNKKFSAFSTTDLIISHFYEIAKESFADELESTPFAKQSLNVPSSTMELAINEALRGQRSIKRNALHCVMVFNTTLYPNISMVKLRDEKNNDIAIAEKQNS